MVRRDVVYPRIVPHRNAPPKDAVVLDVRPVAAPLVDTAYVDRPGVLLHHGALHQGALAVVGVLGGSASPRPAAARRAIPQMTRKMGHLAVVRPNDACARFRPSDPQAAYREVIP
jgi:hypothetical protein